MLGQTFYLYATDIFVCFTNNFYIQKVVLRKSSAEKCHLTGSEMLYYVYKDDYSV